MRELHLDVRWKLLGFLTPLVGIQLSFTGELPGHSSAR